jgi:hypothetical protein
MRQMTQQTRELSTVIRFDSGELKNLRLIRFESIDLAVESVEILPFTTLNGRRAAQRSVAIH